MWTQFFTKLYFVSLQLFRCVSELREGSWCVVPHYHGINPIRTLLTVRKLLQLHVIDPSAAEASYVTPVVSVWLLGLPAGVVLAVGLPIV